MHFPAIFLLSALLEVAQGAAAGTRPSVTGPAGSRPSLTGFGGSQPNPTAFGGSPPGTGFGGTQPNLAGFGGSQSIPTGFGGSRPNPAGPGGSQPTPPTGFGGSRPNPTRPGNTRPSPSPTGPGGAPAGPAGNGGSPPPSPPAQPGTCPPVWATVAANLMGKFVDSAGAPTDDARASVRLAFHDCFPGACDGSVILSDECTSRRENAQMVPICSTLGAVAKQFNVGVADTVQLAAALGIMTALGPAIPFKVGRKDTSTANAANQLPAPTDSADSIIAAFAAKGFSSMELVALLGSHSAAKNLAGVAFDSTVNRLDTNFYSETQNGTAPTSLQSDVNLSQSSVTSGTWKGFSTNLNGWQAAFVPAMQKISLIGIDEATLVDCSSLIKRK